MLDEGAIQSIASAYNVLRPDPLLWESWSGALSSGAYKFGQGVMRSGDDEYDPVGVLAAISGADWTWDETEEAWAYQGNTYALTAEAFAEWIGVRYHEDLKRAGFTSALERLQVSIIEQGDKAASLHVIGELLKRAQARADTERERLKRIPLRDLRTIGDGYIDEKYIRAPRSPYADGGY